MKSFSSIAVVVALLLGAAIFYSNRTESTPVPEPPPAPPTMKTPAAPTPTTAASAPGTLTMKASISNGYLLAGGERDMYAAVDIEAIDHHGASRPPLNLAVVIDRSGSMSGTKIEHAKAAALQLVEVLEPRDRVAVISYGSDVTVDFPSRPVTPANRAGLRRAIEAVAIGGGTNLSGGWSDGLDQVLRWKTDDSVNRVILMSDGHANVGETRPEALTAKAALALSRGVSVTTMGVGLDYNEDLMTAMAREGAGNYHFIDRSDSIVELFAAELQGLAATVARNTSLVLELGPGVSLEQIYGFAHDTSGSRIFISLAEFHAKQQKNILVRLRVDPKKAGRHDILQADLSYDDVVREQPTHHSVQLASVTTTDPAKAEEAVDVAVIARVQQIEVASTMDEAMRLYERGKSQEATEMIDRTQRSMRKRRAKYQLPKPESYDRVDRELDDMKQDVSARPAASSEGKRLIKEKKARGADIFIGLESF